MFPCLCMCMCACVCIHARMRTQRNCDLTVRSVSRKLTTFRE